MVEFVEGSGFYPPTINTYSDIDSFTSEDISNNQTKTLTLTLPDVIQATNLNYNLAIDDFSSPSMDPALMIVNLKYNNDLVASYTGIVGTIGRSTFVDNVLNYSQKFNRNDVIKLEISITGGGAGIVSVNASLGIGGSYTL